MTLANPWITGPATGENFYNLPNNLLGVETKWVYIGVPHKKFGGKRLTFNLLGSNKGREGLTLAPQAAGLMHAPFETLFSEGPYQLGAVPERTDWKKRTISIGVQVNPDIAPRNDGKLIDTPFRYRMLEDRWWNSWSATEDGYFGCWTRTHGWRWLRVRLASEAKTPFEYDPVAQGNNWMQWDMEIVACQPFYSKRTEMGEWENTVDTSTPWALIEDLLNEYIPGLHVGEGTIRVPNRGDRPAYPKFLVSSPGKCWIQEGSRWVELPLLTPQDGFILVDTDPNEIACTSTTDPYDPVFMRILRNSQILTLISDHLLGGLLDTTLPVWRRMTDRFTEASAIPAYSDGILRVRHSNANGKVIAFVPQRYEKAYG